MSAFRARAGKVRLLPPGARVSAVFEAMAPDLEEVTQRAATIARTLANADTGFMRSRIEGAIGFEGKQLAGVVFNGADYGIWQETEPGDALPGGGARKRGGGRAHLRPGVLRALQEAGWI